MNISKLPTVERAERFVSYGAPTCDICAGLDKEDRPAEGDYWPAQPVSFINGDAEAAVEFWNLTVCNHHIPQDDPDEATHKIRFKTFNMEDHHMNSAVGREAIEVHEL